MGEVHLRQVYATGKGEVPETPERGRQAELGECGTTSERLPPDRSQAVGGMEFLEGGTVFESEVRNSVDTGLKGQDTKA